MFNARNVAQGRSATSPGTCHGNTLGQSTGRSHMIRACPRLQHTHTNTASGSISTRYGCVHGGILPPFCQTTKQPRHREHQKQQNRRTTRQKDAIKPTPRPLEKSWTSENIAMEANGARQRIDMPTFTHGHCKVTKTYRNTTTFGLAHLAAALWPCLPRASAHHIRAENPLHEIC